MSDEKCTFTEEDEKNIHNISSALMHSLPDTIEVQTVTCAVCVFVSNLLFNISEQSSIPEIGMIEHMHEALLLAYHGRKKEEANEKIK